jgi:hypothetical protein
MYSGRASTFMQFSTPHAASTGQRLSAENAIHRRSAKRLKPALRTARFRIDIPTGRGAD